MTAMQKASWLLRVNPYERDFLRDAFKEGARAFWRGEEGGTFGYRQMERAAYWRGYAAAKGAAGS